MKNVDVPSLNDSAKYITEFTVKCKEGHHITYEKRIIEAKQDE